jgi:beta-xylosidase
VVDRSLVPPGGEVCGEPQLLAFGFAWLAIGSARAGATDLAAHDPSRITAHAGRYWVFSTGRGCRTASSTNLTHWVQGPRVFPAPLTWWAAAAPGNNGDVWAPDVLRFNDRFHLYYSVSVFGKNTSAIGLATSPTLDPAAPDFGWKDEGIVIQTTADDGFNAIDPAPVIDAGSGWPLGPTGRGSN